MTKSKTETGVAEGETIETTRFFRPEFGPDGLIPAIVTDSASGDVLMFAYMNEDALTQTIASGFAHFWSRSRAKLWKKGDESGNLLKVIEMRTDCDQDVIWISVEVRGRRRRLSYRGAVLLLSPSCAALRSNSQPGVGICCVAGAEEGRLRIASRRLQAFALSAFIS